MRTSGDAYESAEYRDGVAAQMAAERGERPAAPAGDTRHFAFAAQAAKDQRGWSVRDLAARTGLPVDTVDRAVTTGHVLLSTALRIAAVLDLPAGDLGSPR